MRPRRLHPSICELRSSGQRSIVCKRPMMQSKIAYASSPGSIHLSTSALTPLGPEKSKLRVFSFLVFLMSLTCAIALPIGIDLVDSRIYTPQDVEKVVGFHPLGILLNDDDFRQEISDEYYFRLAAGVDHAFRNSGVRTFLFT